MKTRVVDHVDLLSLRPGDWVRVQTAGGSQLILQRGVDQGVFIRRPGNREIHAIVSQKDHILAVGQTMILAIANRPDEFFRIHDVATISVTTQA